jgi:hypothetical protein
VDVYNINGGFTYPARNLIFVFRKEEFPKVFLHETLHHTRLDTHQKWNADDVNALYNFFRIDQTGCPLDCDTQLTPNEAFVEAWANVYQLAFLTHEYRFSFDQMLKTEQRWACIQAKRLLRHQDAFFQSWKEKTHAYSYIVIRSALLWNLDKFLKKQNHATSANMYKLVTASFENAAYQACLASAVVPKRHNSFRMTIFGDM